MPEETARNRIPIKIEASVDQSKSRAGTYTAPGFIHRWREWGGEGAEEEGSPVSPKGASWRDRVQVREIGTLSGSLSIISQPSFLPPSLLLLRPGERDGAGGRDAVSPRCGLPCESGPPLPLCPSPPGTWISSTAAERWPRNLIGRRQEFARSWWARGAGVPAEFNLARGFNRSRANTR